MQWMTMTSIVPCKGIQSNKINTSDIDTNVHSAHTQSCLLVLMTMNVSNTPICPVISRLYISDMFEATLPNASRI